MHKRNVRSNGEPYFINLIESYPMSPEDEPIANVLAELKQQPRLAFIKKQLTGETRIPPRSELHTTLDFFFTGRGPLEPTPIVSPEGVETGALQWSFETVASAASDIAKQISRDRDSRVEHTSYPAGTTSKVNLWKLVAVTDTYLAGNLLSRHRRIDLPRLRELSSYDPTFRWAAAIFEGRDTPTAASTEQSSLLSFLENSDD